jgi:adenylate cyclase
VTFANRLSNRIGALPARHVTWGLVLVFSAWVLLDVLVFKFSGGLAQSSYDAMVRARVVTAAPDPRIVIIDIDEASLARMGKEFGRWPWPRDTLATVLTHLERQQPAAVVWDVMFADADRISPGGDAAFNVAAQQSMHSHFCVVRLPAANDASSALTQNDLPGLWLAQASKSATNPAQTATVALIAPALPALASSRLGFNNGYVDADGVLRRYRYAELLADGERLQSLPLSVLSAMDKESASAYQESTRGHFYQQDELLVWRSRPNMYPRVSFADVFAQAEAGKPMVAMPSMAGKVILIGATAPSLHDIHATPMSSAQAGVDTLATAIDNALNRRHLAELPRWLQAALAVALCVALALWVQFRSMASLTPALLALPAVLLGISYLSLNGSPIFLDLHLAAGLALVFLTVLRFWGTLRRKHWCEVMPVLGINGVALWPLRRSGPWLDADLDRLIDALERHAPNCRVIACDTQIIWPNTLRWPELATVAAIVGTTEALQTARPKLAPAMARLTIHTGELTLLSSCQSRTQLARAAAQAWVTLPSTENNHDKETNP